MKAALSGNSGSEYRLFPLSYRATAVLTRECRFTRTIWRPASVPPPLLVRGVTRPLVYRNVLSYMYSARCWYYSIDSSSLRPVLQYRVGIGSTESVINTIGQSSKLRLKLSDYTMVQLRYTWPPTVAAQPPAPLMRSYSDREHCSDMVA
jgi:hypothetical protein